MFCKMDVIAIEHEVKRWKEFIQLVSITVATIRAKKQTTHELEHEER